MHLTIRQRILLTFTLIFIIGGILELYIAGRRLQAAAIEFFQHDLETEALAAATSLSGSIEHFYEGEDRQGFLNALSDLQRRTTAEYVIIDNRRSVLLASDDYPQDTSGMLLETPELLDATRSTIGTDTRSDTFYVAVPLSAEGEHFGFLILANSLTPAYVDAQRRWMELIISTLPVLALGMIGSLWLARGIAQPIHQLHESALAMANGKLDTRIAVTSKDEVGELAHAFNFMAGRLEDLIRVQRSFVSNAAHELRTPLMSLKLRAEALQDANLPADERETYLREINTQTEHMAHLVTSLLTLARLDEGRHPGENGSGDTSALLRDIARNWRIQAQKAGLAFHDSIPDALSDIPISGGDLRMVLDNLFGNALKYTSAGSISFNVSESPTSFTLAVSDTGAGFTQEDGARIFERFFRADSTRSIHGTGLGLSIVQSITDYYGGQVRARSDGPGKGACFEITIPKLKP